MRELELASRRADERLANAEADARRPAAAE
jgi:hypothetical protein